MKQGGGIQDAIGTEFNQKAISSFTTNRTTATTAFLKDTDISPLLLQKMAGGQPGYACPDNGDLCPDLIIHAVHELMMLHGAGISRLFTLLVGLQIRVKCHGDIANHQPTGIMHLNAIGEDRYQSVLV